MLYDIIYHGGGGDCVHPDEIKARLTEEQLFGWLAWITRKPRGEALTANLNAISIARIRESMHGKAEKWSDFVPQWQEWGNKYRPKPVTRAQRLLTSLSGPVK